MALTNMVTLIGNMGSDAHLLTSQKDGKEFTALSIATTDSYQNDAGEWVDKETIWHNVVAFSPTVIAMLKNLKKGTRIKIEGSLSYRPYDVVNGEGDVITKKEASIIAYKVEQAPLVRKNNES
ncbi:MAG: single-stranded DNA-binding protein [Chitinophagales bacterium]|nr:single-stranded DNA-binding protein [Chitinophagales bacterium]